MGLTVREQELVILRMARLYGSDYVWKHHVPVATEFGVSCEEVAAVSEGAHERFASSREKALLLLTDELVEQRSVSPQTWAHHASPLPAGDVVDLIALVSQYTFFALMNNVLQVPVEDALADVPGLAELV
jgi:alkylhydroperoxidase family enzyme